MVFPPLALLIAFNTNILSEHALIDLALDTD